MARAIWLMPLAGRCVRLGQETEGAAGFAQLIPDLRMRVLSSGRLSELLAVSAQVPAVHDDR
jgi:hypothetical protein